MREVLDRRRKETTHRITELRALLDVADKLCTDKACVYVTGSFGRRETSQYSDLDLFIAGYGTSEKPALSRLDEILVKADLIDATRKLNIPEFSGDGAYLKHHTVAELLQMLGTPHDDVSNTFTARLLLFLESAPLIGSAVYKRITDDVIAEYWGDYEDHKNDFIPAFLANDVLRMWRTFCVNYEARTEREPEQERAKRRLTNYKLKHSRLLTCYSALLYLLTVFSKTGTVSPLDAAGMISLTPTQRLEWMLSQPELAAAHTKISELLDRYEKFLENTEVPKEELMSRFLDKEKRKEYGESAYRFGDLIWDVLDIVGNRNRFHRLLIV